MPKPTTPRRTVVESLISQPTRRPQPQWPTGPTFDPDCKLCPRLVQFLADGLAEYPHYYSRPVPPFGDPKAHLIIVGLAPGFHGANATGRAFTGDYAGLLLYRTLHRFGFASRPESITGDDNLRLIDCRIVNSVKCVPPENKPTPQEIRACNRYLAADLATIPPRSVLLGLGSIGHNALLRTLGLRAADYPFGHAAEHALPGGHTLIDSYHCSRYNTQTRRLTDEMFADVFQRARELIDRR